MGREDIDVRCLGRGRPFVLEVKEPKKRSFNAEKLAEIINEAAQGSVEVSSIRPSTRSEVVRIKDTPAEKSYTIRFTLEPMNEAEYAVLTAPVDMTKEDVQTEARSDADSAEATRVPTAPNRWRPPLRCLLPGPAKPNSRR